MTVRIILAEDHIIMREGLSSLLFAYPDITVVGEAENGRETVKLTRKYRPDVVIMDVSMPDLNGIDATTQIMQMENPPKVIALSMHSDKRFVEKMLAAGASAYLLKNCATKEFVHAIREVIAGRIYLSPGITGIVVKGFLKNLADNKNPGDVDLTMREKEIVQLISEGWDTKNIAVELHVSPKTVETHRRRIMEKLNINGVAKLTRYAIREGLTPLDE